MALVEVSTAKSAYTHHGKSNHCTYGKYCCSNTKKVLSTLSFGRLLRASLPYQDPSLSRNRPWRGGGTNCKVSLIRTTAKATIVPTGVLSVVIHKKSSTYNSLSFGRLLPASLPLPPPRMRQDSSLSRHRTRGRGSSYQILPSSNSCVSKYR